MDIRINWYPGHMAKAKRQLIEQLAQIDVVIEVCDARLPSASRNPDLAQWLGNKKRVLVLNKSDLADPAATTEWISYYKGLSMEVVPFSASHGKGKRELLAAIERLVRDDVNRMKARGVFKTVRAMVVGIPNVGKSTLTNALFGGAATRTGDKPGVTRGRQWVKVSAYLEFLDTPGLLWPKLEDPSGARFLAYAGTIPGVVVDNEALCAAFLTDMRTIAPQGVAQRLKLDALEGDGHALLESACRKRGWLIAGGEADTARGAAVILDEFRAGKMGTITLERPERSSPGGTQ